MESYSQAIYALDSPHHSKADTAEVSPVGAWLLPNFLTVVFAVTLLQVLFLSAGMPRLFHDSDTGWHIRNGERILAAAAVPRDDDFSYTMQGQPWLSWEWLSDAVLGASHRIAGLSGVALIAAAAIALTAYGAARLALSLGGNLFFTTAGTVLLLGVTSMHWLARPHLFSWIFALVFLFVAEAERRDRTRTLWVLPVLAVLWANMHGSFLLGPAILFIYALGEWLGAALPSPSGRGPGEGLRTDTNLATLTRHVRLRLPRRPLPEGEGWRLALASVVSLIATFINPYGWRLHEHLFTYLQSDYLMDHIQEFGSFSFHSTGALYVEMFLVVAALGTLALLKQRALGPALLSLGMLHLSLYSARHLATAAVLLLPLSISALTREVDGWPGFKNFLRYSERLRAIDQRVYGIVPMAIILALTVFGVNALANKNRVGFDTGTFPVHAADFLENRHVSGRLFSTDQWGGYLIYRFDGSVKVFLDGRSDFYGQGLLESYGRVISVKPGWDNVLKQYDVRIVLVPPDSSLASVLQSRTDWKCIYSDSVSTVYERAV